VLKLTRAVPAKRATGGRAIAYPRALHMQDRPISSFIRRHYRHFNAAALVDAAEGYNRHLAGGGKMLVTLAGAMSTAELGISLAEMIRQGKVHAICCTGANLEEDVFNLVAHDHYERVPHYRQLTPQDEKALLDRHMNRVTDTCIPEMEAMRRIEDAVLAEWVRADQAGERLFPHEFMYRSCAAGCSRTATRSTRRTRGCWPRPRPTCRSSCPGWEDSTLGNMFAGHVISGDVKNVHTVRTGIEYMIRLADWYTRATRDTTIGFFQIGGGIAGDFPICVVPMLHQDLRRTEVPAVGLLLPDQRLDDQLRLVLRRRPQREDHVGQARRRYARLHHRVRRDHRRAAGVRVHPRLVTPPRDASSAARRRGTSVFGVHRNRG
jgi:deoxyhypusine synthase